MRLGYWQSCRVMDLEARLDRELGCGSGRQLGRWRPVGADWLAALRRLAPTYGLEVGETWWPACLLPDWFYQRYSPLVTHFCDEFLPIFATDELVGVVLKEDADD